MWSFCALLSFLMHPLFLLTFDTSFLLLRLLLLLLPLLSQKRLAGQMNEQVDDERLYLLATSSGAQFVETLLELFCGRRACP